MGPLRCLVVTLGNPLHGSDRFGHAVAERLRARDDLPSRADVVDGATDLLAWVDRFRSYHRVVLVDAVLGASCREVGIVEETEFDAWPPHGVTCHAISPLISVKVFRALEPDASTRFSLVALKLDPAAFGAEITPAEAEAGADAVLQVLRQTA